MKKLFAMLLAITVMATMSVTAFATDNTVNYNGGENPQTSGMNVTYNVSPTFSVTIPANVALGNSVTVSAADVVVEYGKAVNVKLSGTSETDNSFVLRTEQGAELSYTVKKGEAAVRVGDTILSVIPGSDETTAELTFLEPASYTYAGNYTGSVTFTIAVEAAGNN
jgi:hypothetical protein